MNNNIEHRPQRLRKAISDASVQMDMYEKLGWEPEAAAIETTIETDVNNRLKAVLDMIEEVEQVVCECCGLTEDCTQRYITQVKDGYSGKWVCGLCSEVVKDKLARSKAKDMHEAVSLHREFCQSYNNTTRLNPKLSLTCAMREIAKRSWENRTTNTNSSGSNNSMMMRISKITRTTSCFPKIDV